MDKRYRVNGIFFVELNASNVMEAREKAHRILKADGIKHNVIEIEEVKVVERKDTENHNSRPPGPKRAATAGGAGEEGVCIHTARDTGI